MRYVLAVIVVLGIAEFSLADVFNMKPGLTSLETVSVGDPGNMADNNGFGAVNYLYEIDKYEVTAAQYTEFLNAKAKIDPYGLYNTSMSSETYGCKIQRTGISGSYSYSVAADWANRPVNYVSFWDAVRFTNWLQNGQGNGDTEDGAYTITAAGISANTIIKNGNAQWWVTSENEWYKAAYYKGGGVSAGYWLYPTQSNNAPGRDMSEVSNPGNNANYAGTPFPIDSGHHTTVVGEFELSDSAYGTFDQGGNVYEWNDVIIGTLSRGLRGGSHNDWAYTMTPPYQYNYPPTSEYAYIGFRVASVPEPSAFMLVGIGAMSLIAYARQRGSNNV